MSAARVGAAAPLESVTCLLATPGLPTTPLPAQTAALLQYRGQKTRRARPFPRQARWLKKGV